MTPIVCRCASRRAGGGSGGSLTATCCRQLYLSASSRTSAPPLPLPSLAALLRRFCARKRVRAFLATWAPERRANEQCAVPTLTSCAKRDAPLCRARTKHLFASSLQLVDIADQPTARSSRRPVGHSVGRPAAQHNEPTARRAAPPPPMQNSARRRATVSTRTIQSLNLSI